MSGEARISEREAVMREREAFHSGVCYQEAQHRAALCCNYVGNLGKAKAERLKRYPLPQVERPRVMRSVGLAYRVIGGLVETQEILDVCCPHEIRWQVQTMIRACDAELVADLLAIPTEIVDEPDPGVSS